MKKKILYIGTVNFSRFLLKEILEYKSKIEILIVSSQKKINSDFVDMNEIAKKENLAIHLTSNINSVNSYKIIKKFKPDYIFCFGWSKLINKKIINCANDFAIGYHPAELPKNRGRHPIIWAIYLGLKLTASTFFQLTETVDDGKIIDQKIIKIKKNYKSLDLYNALIKVSKKQIKTIMKKIVSNKKINIYKKKNENIWRKRSFVDGIIDWRMSGKSIIRLVNALSKPYPGASFKFKNKYININEAKIIKKKPNNIEPGKILDVSKKNFKITCDDYIIKIIMSEAQIKLKKNTYL